MSGGRRFKPLTPAEVDALDPAFIDSVAGDRLIATVRILRERMDFLAGQYANHVHIKVAMWLAGQQGDLPEAARWAVSDVEEWLDWGDIASSPWAHDWRKFWNSRDSLTGEPARPCGICGEPATTWSGTREKGLAACGDRHWKALNGRLADEQCRLCNEVVVCAYDLDGSPVCADCWPGERLLAERRAAWSDRFAAPTDTATGADQ